MSGKVTQPSIVEEKMLLVKKYGVIGVAVLLFPFVEPAATKYWNDQKAKELNKIKTEFTRSVKTEIYNCSSKSNKVETDTLHEIARVALERQSMHEVRALKDIMRVYNWREEKNEERIKTKIRNMLIAQRTVSVEFLNKFAPHPKVGRVGDYIRDNFPMESLIEDICAIALGKYKVETRAEDMMQHMLYTQKKFFDDMYKAMNKEN